MFMYGCGYDKTLLILYKNKKFGDENCFMQMLAIKGMPMSSVVLAVTPSI